MCPSGLGCREGALHARLHSRGEFPCPAGYKCVGDVTACPQRCAKVTCRPDQHCDEDTGLCVDLCAGVVCNAPADLQAAATASTATTLGCAPGRPDVLRRRLPDRQVRGRQVRRRHQYCDDGKCVDLCPPDKCPAASAASTASASADKCATGRLPGRPVLRPADRPVQGRHLPGAQCRRASAASRLREQRRPVRIAPTRASSCSAPATATCARDGRRPHGTCVSNGKCSQTRHRSRPTRRRRGCGCAVGGGTIDGLAGARPGGSASSRTRRRRTLSAGQHERGIRAPTQLARFRRRRISAAATAAALPAALVSPQMDLRIYAP